MILVLLAWAMGGIEVFSKPERQPISCGSDFGADQEMKGKTMSFTIGRVGGPLPSASASTSTPLVDRLMNSAANAEQLLVQGTKLSGLSREEFFAIIDKTPVISD